MPANKSAVLRYRVIDQLLRNRQKKYPTLEELRDEVECRLFGPDSNSISRSTIEKDLRAMRDDTSLGINAPIAYNKKEKGYYYSDPTYSINGMGLTEEDQYALREAAGLLRVFADFPVFASLRVAVEKISTRVMLPGDLNDSESEQYIHFEQAEASPGVRWIKPIYEAIVNRKTIVFDYVRIYQQGDIKQRVLEPYQLREKHNRWYVIGYTRKHKRFTTYSLDRIQQLETGASFYRNSDFNESDFYRDSVGIMTQTGDPQQVILDVSGPPALMIQFNPIHPSQQVLSNSGDIIRFGMQVAVNEELVSQLLPFCRYLKVVEPMQLRQMILAELEQGLFNQRTAE